LRASQPRAKSEKLSETFAEHSGMGRRRTQLQRPLLNFTKGIHAPSTLLSGLNEMDSYFSEARCTFQMILNFTKELCPSITTPEWLGMQAGRKNWSSCLAIIGGHRCPDM